MLLTIGEYLKNKRLSLKQSRKEFSKDVIDSSYLARVENNKNEIRAKSLIELLNKNHISLSDFLENLDCLNLRNHEFEIKASEAFFNHDVRTLKSMIKGYSCKSSSVAVLVVEFMIDQLDPQAGMLNANSKKLIKKFLLETEEWDENNLWVIANCIDLYSLDEINGIVKKIIDNYTYFDEYSDFQLKLLAQIAVKYLEIVTKAGVLKYLAFEVYRYLNRFPSRSIIFHEKLKAEYLRSIKDDKNKKMFEFLKY